MPIYEYRCEKCGTVKTSEKRADMAACLNCDGIARRVWGFSYKPGFREGYNPSLGTHVSNRSQLKSALSEASERASSPVTYYDAEGNAHLVERPPHDFKPVDMRDKAAVGVTNDGLDSTYDALKRAGRDDQARRLKALMDE